MHRRRDFIRKASVLAAGSLAAGGMKESVLGAQGLVDSAQGGWDMSWTERLTGRHKMVFDAPEASEATALHHVRSFLAGYATAYGLTDADLSAVLVLRHKSTVFAFEDELWSDGLFAERSEMVDPETGEPARRNPVLRVKPGSQHSYTWPDGALDNLIERGVIVLVCDLALRNLASQVARKRSISHQDAVDLMRQNIVSGIILQPTGVFATCHAQSMGCGFLQSV